MAQTAKTTKGTSAQAQAPAPDRWGPHPRPELRALRIECSSLPAGQALSISLGGLYGPSRFVLGGDNPIGLSLRAPGSAGRLAVAGMRLTRSYIQVTMAEATPIFSIDTYIETAHCMASGAVAVPQGATLTLQSDLDVQTVVGLSSWYVQLR